MGYTKFIKYGDNFEIYEYENEPSLVKRRRRKRETNIDNKNMGIDGENTLSERQLGKRKDNARHASMVFRRIVISNLSGSELPVLLTLTYKENLTNITVGYKDYRSFIQALRNKYGKTFRYICVPEFQKRGAVHFHALFWGLPSEVALQERATRTLARIWGKGFLYLKITDGNNKLSSYLAKYMSKAFIDPRLKNKKAYVASRNINRPIVQSGIFMIWPVLDDYVGNTNPESDKTYNTRRLGRCRHRLFKIEN
jgi:hypothetical protein